MKKIKINNEAYILDVEKAEELGLLKKENTLPKSWEEFCEKHPIKEGECYIALCSEIEEYKPAMDSRNPSADRFILPDKQTTKAMLALCQLIQLRDCYNDGWKPNWKERTVEKYIISCSSDVIIRDVYFQHNAVLCFKTNELRNEFLENFEDLIEIAKHLL